MNLLTEIHCQPGLNLLGRTIHRTAVRGVVLQGRNLLMIYSANVGDYKFPGGGVGAGETHTQALCREVQEESGVSVLRVGAEIGTVIEYNTPLEKEYDAFEMTSHYYLCDVQGGFGAQKLDDYEQALGFTPVWIDIDQAIQLNKSLLQREKTVRWLHREIFVLEYLRRTILSNPDT